MRSSAHNLTNITNRPTVEFFYIVRGRTNRRRKETVEQVDVRTNRNDAETVFRKIIMNEDGFVRLYRVAGRTKSAMPDFNARLLQQRVATM